MLDARGQGRFRLALRPTPHRQDGRRDGDDARPDSRLEEHECLHAVQMDDTAPVTIPG